MTPSLTLMTMYSQCLVFQSEAGCGAGVGGRQYLCAGAAAPSPHQQEASRRSPARVEPPPLLELVTLLPAPAGQGIAAGLGSSSFSSPTGHNPILGVAVPGGGERGHCAREGDT